MAKIKALLDQETWVEIDVPEEFQSIINILFSSDVLTSGNLNGTEEDNAHSYSDNNADAVHSNAEHQVEQTNSIETSRKSAGSDGSKPLVDSVEPNRGNNRISSAQNNNVEKDHKKSVSQALLYKGVGYHMVNWLVFWTQLFPIGCTFHSLFCTFHCSFSVNKRV